MSKLRVASGTHLPEYLPEPGVQTKPPGSKPRLSGLEKARLPSFLRSQQVEKPDQLPQNPAKPGCEDLDFWPEPRGEFGKEKLCLGSIPELDLSHFWGLDRCSEPKVSTVFAGPVHWGEVRGVLKGYMNEIHGVGAPPIFVHFSGD